MKTEPSDGAIALVWGRQAGDEATQARPGRPCRAGPSRKGGPARRRMRALPPEACGPRVLGAGGWCSRTRCIARKACGGRPCRAHQQRPTARIEARLAERERLLDTQPAAPEHDDQRAQARSVTGIASLPHDCDDLLDGRRVSRVAHTLVARRVASVIPRQRRRRATPSGGIQDNRDGHGILLPIATDSACCSTSPAATLGSAGQRVQALR